MKKLFLATVLLFSSQLSHAQSAALDYIVAIVNDEVIVYSQLQNATQVAIDNLRQQQIRMPSQAELERQVLEKMIITRLQMQLAERTGISIDEASLNQTLRGLASQNKVDLATFREVLERDGYNFQYFRENIREEMTLRRLQQRQVVSRINVTDSEINNFLSNQAQQGDGDSEYRLLHILIATPEAASPEQIAQQRSKAEQVLQTLQDGANFQEVAAGVSDSQNALQGGDLGWRKSGEIPSLFLQPVMSMDVGDVSEIIRNAGGFHIIQLAEKRGGQQVITQTLARHILMRSNQLTSEAEVERRLQSLRYRIENGDDFAELAKANSEDIASASEGGDLGWQNPGELVPEFEQVMNNLSENAISQPFKSRFGWHIVQVLQRRQHDNTVVAQRTEAAQQIRQRKIDEELQNWLRQLRDEAYVDYRLEGMRG